MDKPRKPESKLVNKISRAALQAIGGGVPFAGGVFSAAAGAWSEQEQEEVNKFFECWIKMLEDEIREKELTMLEILARLNLQDEKIKERLESPGYQSLARKTFREWAVAESEERRQYIRNVLSNAAATDLASDDVVKLFIDWINRYSEMHFHVIGAIYNSSGISRGEVWMKIGKEQVREDSAEADLYKLLFRDLSTGGIIRQHRPVDHEGNFLAKPVTRSRKPKVRSRTMKSAFDTHEMYELTALGQQFVHYAMNELTPRIEYKTESSK